MSEKTFEKTLEVLAEEIVTKFMDLTDEATDTFIIKMESLIAKKKKQRAEQEAKKHNPTRAELVREFNSFGYQVPSDAKFFKVNETSKGKRNVCGMQVGTYTHSCHVDTTDFVVLLFADGHVEDVDSLWLPEVK